jgi:hypothetical protein
MHKLKNLWSLGFVIVGTVYLVYLSGLVYHTFAQGWGWFFVAYFSINILILQIAILISGSNVTKPTKGKSIAVLAVCVVLVPTMYYVPVSRIFMVIILVLAVFAVVKSPKSNIVFPQK